MTTQAGHTHEAGGFASPEAHLQMLNQVLARNWWAVAIRGLASIVFGAIALTLPQAAILAFLIVFAAYLLVDGVFAIVSAVRAARRHERWGLLVLEGVADLIAAVIALALPGIALLAFMILVAVWAVITGVLALVAAFRLHIDHGRVWMAIGGIASIILGVLIVIAPLLGAVVLTWWVGAYAIVSGVSLCILAFQLRARANDHGPGEAARA
jgi:uncharacterized membrane protein HdeD (DUF308 family)